MKNQWQLFPPPMSIRRRTSFSIGLPSDTCRWSRQGENCLQQTKPLPTLSCFSGLPYILPCFTSPPAWVLMISTLHADNSRYCLPYSSCLMPTICLCESQVLSTLVLHKFCILSHHLGPESWTSHLVLLVWEVVAFHFQQVLQIKQAKCFLICRHYRQDITNNGLPY